MAPRFDWDPQLETGNDLVDTQHQRIYELLNELLAADASEKDIHTVAEVLDALALYSATHFGAEEALMTASGYPQELSTAHTAEHRDLTEKTRDFVLEYRAGNVSSIVPVAEFLCSWLGHHIEDEDRRLVEHIRAVREAG